MICCTLNYTNDIEKKTYSELLSEISTQRQEFKTLYKNASISGKDSVIVSARNYLMNAISVEVFPHWYGTPWDYNGTTRIPKKGKIACGYFITNTLTDVGFNIPRIKWAQSASELFIKKLSFNHIKRFHNKPISAVKKYLSESGNGLYLVGLDNHVGYVFVKDTTIRFIHADYYNPDVGVVSEKIDSQNPLNDSSYRVFGKLLSDEMIRKWIQGIPFK